MTITRVSALRWRVMRELRFCLVFTQPQTQTNVLLARHFILSPLCLFKLARYDRGCRLHIKRLTSRSSKPPRRQMSPSSLRRKGQDALLMSAASSEYSKGPGRRVVCVFCTGIVCERERERPLITQMHIGGSANALHTRGRFAFVRAAAAAFGSRVGGGGEAALCPSLGLCVARHAFVRQFQFIFRGGKSRRVFCLLFVCLREFSRRLLRGSTGARRRRVK